MFSRRSGYHYESVSQRDSITTPGLFTSSFGQSSGLSYDFVPKTKNNDFTDQTQGFISWLCNLVVIALLFICILITFPISAWFVLKTVPNYERIVVFRLGRIRAPKGPGVVLVLPLIDQWQRVDLRTRAFNIPPCKVTTKDGGLVSIGADIQFRIWNPVMSVVAVQDLNASTRLAAQNAMTQSLNKHTVRQIQTERIKLGEYLGLEINDLTKPWGLEVDRVELTLENVLRSADEPHLGPVIMPPSVPGLEGLESLTGPIQQLAMHFLRPSTAADGTAQDAVIFTDEVSTEASVAENSRQIEELLAAVSQVLSESLVKQVGACFQFYICKESGSTSSYYVDLTQNSGACGPGEASQSDVTLSMSEQDLMAMFQGRLGPFAAYSSGRLKVQGDLNIALKLNTLIKMLKPL